MLQQCARSVENVSGAVLCVFIWDVCVDGGERWCVADECVGVCRVGSDGGHWLVSLYW